MLLIYLDNASTTAVDLKVVKAMEPYLKSKYGNPSEYHRLGLEAKAAVEGSRQKVAGFFKAKTEEIIFTSCATEAINLAHKGLIESFLKIKPKPHIITTSIEHKAVLEACISLERQGKAKVTYLLVDHDGRIHLEALKRAITPATVLVSVMYVNNEVGTIQPVREVGQYLKKINKNRKHKIYFHTDATQAVSSLDCKVDYLGVDLLSFTGHKIHAPKGIGALYIRRGTSIIRQMDGGGQEKGLRAGTENVPYIVGLGKTVSNLKDSKRKGRKITALRDRLIKGMLKVEGVKPTGHPNKRAANIASFVIKGVEGEALVLKLSELGIYASSGSACTSSDLSPSHVLTSMGYNPKEAHGSLRLSLSAKTTKDEIDKTLSIMPKVIADLRRMNPVY